MKMKMYNIKDLDKFMNLVDECKGEVYVISSEGDKLNLKSKLTQFVALSSLFSSGYIEKLELETKDDEDAAKLLNFMIEGNQ